MRRAEANSLRDTANRPFRNLKRSVTLTEGRFDDVHTPLYRTMDEEPELNDPLAHNSLLYSSISFTCTKERLVEMAVNVVPFRTNTFCVGSWVKMARLFW